MSTSDGQRASKKKISLVGEIDDKDEIEEPLLGVNKAKVDPHIKSNRNLKKLILVTIVCTIFMIVEVIGGYLASSIAYLNL